MRSGTVLQGIFWKSRGIIGGKHAQAKNQNLGLAPCIFSDELMNTFWTTWSYPCGLRTWFENAENRQAWVKILEAGNDIK